MSGSAARGGAADIRITPDGSAQGQRTAAGLWAAAVARRDHLPAPAPVEEKLPAIRRRLSTGAGSLHIARVRQRAVGFALLVTREPVLELVYLAVAPEAWGTGVGRGLLAYVDARARAVGVGELELWVIDDNERAVRAYRRSGWRRTADLQVRGSPGRPERRLVRKLTLDRGLTGR
ncbi:hypothetical protein GCM10010124_09070 [Pilimelia terevasa]|uniref:N-acetyltransferase domain-containing protein n=1 Tax=Pilimelia terevasa TaxID=53372 RepID=A0A8J3FFM0_9ACTN|nr:GNAT family N-acetyltransferase [Pilimelia terevasa]GGK18649.1 hypothetical protein GCM10010124_09070 [Pilimelia terevasa]